MSRNKQALEEDTLDLLIIADTAGKRPRAYDAVPTGQHHTNERDPDGFAEPDCVNSKTDLVLTETWKDPKTLVLTGPATWRKVNRDRRGVDLWLGADGARSSAGTYTLR